MGRRLSKIFFSFYKNKFCPDLTYTLRYDILQQYVTYLLRYDILQQHVTYLLRHDILQHYVTYLPHEGTVCFCSFLFADLRCFLFVDLFRYHNNVMCFESIECEYIFAPLLLAIRIFSRHFNYWNRCRIKSSTACYL